VHLLDKAAFLNLNSSPTHGCILSKGGWVMAVQKLRAVGVLALMIGTTLSAFAADLPSKRSGEVGAKSCQVTSRTKRFPPARTHNVLRGDGIVGSDMKKIELVLIEQRYADCRIRTSYVFDYVIYNHFQRGSRPPYGRASAYVSLVSGGSVIKKNAISFSVPLGFCGPYGTEGRPFHMEGSVEDNLIDSVDDFRIESTRISGRLGQC
jgi:hypothetical protein